MNGKKQKKRRKETRDSPEEGAKEKWKGQRGGVGDQ